LILRERSFLATDKAVLSVVGPHMTGVGGDAAILVYVAAEQKIWSINAAGTAPALTSIEWFERNAGGRIPANYGLLCASLPTVIDACYTMLDRWGTMTFAEVMEPAIELAENGFPVSGGLNWGWFSAFIPSKRN